MSEATRAISLQEAVKICGPEAPASAVIELAEAFHAFLQSDATPAAAATKPAAAATKPAAAATKPAATKPAATKPAAKATKPAAKTEEQLAQEAADAAAAGDEVTEEVVGADIQALLGANKRNEAVALLKKYGASSKSTLGAEFYEEFHAAAVELLSEELTG